MVARATSIFRRVGYMRPKRPLRWSGRLTHHGWRGTRGTRTEPNIAGQTQWAGCNADAARRVTGHRFRGEARDRDTAAA
jgi:hypothetical protein